VARLKREVAFLEDELDIAKGGWGKWESDDWEV